MKPLVALIPLLVLSASGCGYHVAGKANLLPKDIHTIAVPAFANVTSRSQLADRLSSAMTREFISRTRYNIVSEEKDADAVLKGTLVNYISYPVVSDQASGRATGVQAIVMLSVTLTARGGKVLFTRPNYEFRERYEIAIDQKSYFEESEVAMERLSRDVARTVVSAVLEMF